MQLLNGFIFAKNLTFLDTIHAVSAARYPPFRPSLEINQTMDIHPEILLLIRDCWSQMPNDRPKIDQVIEILYKRTSKSTNLMDHVSKCEVFKTFFRCLDLWKVRQQRWNKT